MAQPLFDELLTPTVLIDRERVQRNITRMQSVCDAHGVQLWPHAKTHKMVEVARMQLAAGARGLVCAKVGEAEALLPSGVTRVFIAYPLVDARLAPRLRALSSSLEELILAATSEAQVVALGNLIDATDIDFPVMVGVDTGNAREGTRGTEATLRVVKFVQQHPRMRLRGLFTHEGQAYGAANQEEDALISGVAQQLRELRERVGEDVELWPGCSVTALRMAQQPGIAAVRPGTYVFGDLSLTIKHPEMQWDDLAATFLSTVVDRPSSDLALVDAGSKTLSGDRTADSTYAVLHDRRDVRLSRCSEEHGWATGSQVDELRVGERVRLVPAHVCPAINLANEVKVIEGDQVVDTWRVAARGCVQ